MNIVTRRLRENGFEVDGEETAALFNAGHRFDAPIFYFGWHSYKMQGPFLMNRVVSISLPIFVIVLTLRV